MRILNEFYRFRLLEEDTRVGPRQYVDHPGAVAIIALDDDNKILVEKNLRIAINKVLLEIPAGLIEEGENPKLTAERELLEETGYIADTWDELFTFYNSAGITNEQTTVFIARNLTFVGKKLDNDEKECQLEQRFISEDELLDIVLSGEENIDAKVPMVALGLKKILERR